MRPAGQAPTPDALDPRTEVPARRRRRRRIPYRPPTLTPGIVRDVRRLPHDPQFEMMLRGLCADGNISTLRCVLRLLRVLLREVDSATQRVGARGPSRLLSGLVASLSPRQRDVLHGLRRGLTEKQLGQALRLSAHTVHAHVKSIYRHFSVSSRAELLALWVNA